MKIKNSFANRGMDFENMINLSLLQWKKEGIVVFKEATPIGIAKDKWWFQKKAHVDYYGLYKGRFVCFEVKSTNNKTFSLKNVPDHQKEHLKNVVENKGIAFLLIYFRKYHKIMILLTREVMNLNVVKENDSTQKIIDVKEGFLNLKPFLDFLSTKEINNEI